MKIFSALAIKIHAATKILLYHVTSAPFLRALFKSSVNTHKSSILELFVTVVLSLSPIWAGALYVLVVRSDPDKSYLGIVNGSVRSGELFLYCAATVAPIFTALFRNFESEFKNEKIIAVVVSSLIIGISFMFYGTQTSGERYDSSILFPVSSFLYLASLLIFYYSSLARNAEPPDVSDIQTYDASSFAQGYSRSRG